MVSRVQTLESQARFEAETGLHHHLICDTCNEITDFQWKSFDGSGLPGNFSKWGRIDSRKATLRGTCKRCLQTVRSGKPKQR
jgi:Fur family peroxide stress response transcriptional regulator